MTEVKVIHERDICIGCCACESIAPKFWKMNPDTKADLIGAKKEDSKEVYVLETDAVAENIEAAQSCPVECIHIEENGVRKI